jgi:antitoxin ParD1/3/4
VSVDLGERLEVFINELIASGRYNSKSEVLREGLRLVQDREVRLAAFEAEIQRGLADIDAGRVESLEDVRRELTARYRTMAEKAEM